MSEFQVTYVVPMAQKAYTEQMRSRCIATGVLLPTKLRSSPESWMTDTKQFTQNTNIMCISTNVEPNS